MQIFVVGINHKTAPIAIREKFYLDETQQELSLSILKNNPAIVEAFVLSTCNRTEIYVHAISDKVTPEELVQLITNIKGVSYNSGLMGYFYNYQDQDALRHLLEVSTGLDSLMLGEKQILGQVKNAFEQSRVNGFLSKNFNILAQVVIRAGKKARTDTDIGCGGSSISWAAIAMAEKILGSLAAKSVLMIGAGEMSKLAVGQISNKGFQKLYLMNRTPEHAKALAGKYKGEVVPFCDIKETLAQVDLCICSSSAPHYILSCEAVERAMRLRNQKQLLLIDISMPRNIDPKVSQIANAKLYHIDELEDVVQENMLKRQKAIQKVEQIIYDKLAEYHDKLKKAGELSSENLSEPLEAI